MPFPKVQSRRLLAELLLQTSQLRPKDQVVIIAATNRMGELAREINEPSAVGFDGLFCSLRLSKLGRVSFSNRDCSYTAIVASHSPSHLFSPVLTTVRR